MRPECAFIEHHPYTVHAAAEHSSKCTKSCNVSTRLLGGLQTLFVSVPVLSLFFTLVWDLIQMNRTQVQCQAVMFVRNRWEVCVCVWLASDAHLIMACPFLPVPPGCQDPWQNEATQMLWSKWCGYVCLLLYWCQRSRLVLSLHFGLIWLENILPALTVAEERLADLQGFYGPADKIYNKI